MGILCGEDWVSFSLDPFHTHQFSDRNSFIVNPISTKFAHLATGRAEKSEWIGLWKTAAQINDGHWIDVLPPPRKRDLKLLPYLIGGINETETSVGATSESRREYTARAGADLRYEVTPQLRLIGTANPDFENIEQAAEILVSASLLGQMRNLSHSVFFPVNSRIS